VHRSHDQNNTFQKFKTADVRHVENGYIYRYISATNRPISMKFGKRMQILMSRIFLIQHWHWKDGQMDADRNNMTVSRCGC